MRQLNVVNGILQSLNGLLGFEDKNGKLNTGSVQEVLLNNIRRIGIAIGGTRGNNGRIGSGLVFDPDSLTISPGVGFTKSGNIIHLSKQVLLEDTGEFSIGDKVWLNISQDKVKLEEADGGLEVETTSSDYTGGGVLVVSDDNATASRTAGGLESILIGTVVTEEEGTPCNTFGKEMSWKSAPRGIAATEGDIIKVDKIYAKEVVADAIEANGEIDLKNIVADTVTVKENLVSKGDTTLEDATISKNLTVLKDVDVGGDITSSGSISSEGAIESSEGITSSKKLTVEKEGFDVTGDSIVNGNLEVTGVLKADKIEGLPEQASGVPIGTMIMHAAAYTSSTGDLSDYVICDGKDYNSSAEAGGVLTWKALFDVIGISWGDGSEDGSGNSGSGDPNSDFNVPDMRNYVPAGSTPIRTSGTKMGSELVALSLGEMPNHTHSMNNGGTTRVDSIGGSGWTTVGTSSNNTNGADGHANPIADSMYDRSASNPHENMQPTAYVNYYIKYR